MRQILSIAKKTEGRPVILDAPEEGWSYVALSEMAEGVYHVTLGKKVPEADQGDDPALDENEIAAGMTFGILARSSTSWDKLTTAQHRTIEKQQELITKLYAQLSKFAEAPEKQDGLKMLMDLAPAVKLLLNAPRADAPKPDEPKK